MLFLPATGGCFGDQGLVEQFNTTAKQRDLARAALFRNAILGSVQSDTNSYFGLNARAGMCRCSDIDGKWRSYTPYSKELE